MLFDRRVAFMKCKFGVFNLNIQVLEFVMFFRVFLNCIQILFEVVMLHDMYVLYIRESTENVSQL